MIFRFAPYTMVLEIMLDKNLFEKAFLKRYKSI